MKIFALFLLILQSTCFAESSMGELKLALAVRTIQHVSNAMLDGGIKSDVKVELDDEIVEDIMTRALDHAQNHSHEKTNFIHWSKDKMVGVKDKVKVLARKQGLVTAIAFVAVEIIEFPVIAVAVSMGHPEVYPIISVIRPEVIVTFTSEILTKVVQHYKLRNSFEDPKNLKLSKKHRKEILKKFGMKKESDILFDTGQRSLVLRDQGAMSKLLTTVFLNKSLSFKTVKRYLKKNSLWNKSCKTINEDKQETNEAKLALILTHFYRQASQGQKAAFEERFKKQVVESNLQSVDDALYLWARFLLEAKSSQEFKERFLLYPRGHHPLVIYNVWQHSVLPGILENGYIFKFGEYRRMMSKILPLQAHTLELMVNKSIPDHGRFEELMTEYIDSVIR